MRYILLLHVNEAGFSRLTKTEQEKGIAAYNAFTDALKKAGAYVASDRLQPSSVATTVRTSDGRTQVLDGPYADTKEQLGGVYYIEATDLDQAISWATRCPAASHGAVEVRPLWDGQPALARG